MRLGGNGGGAGQRCSVKTGCVEGEGAADLFYRDGNGRNEVRSKRGP